MLLTNEWMSRYSEKKIHNHRALKKIAEKCVVFLYNKISRLSYLCVLYCAREHSPDRFSLG
jgi:hypothetical protein